ncbi:hypothetical protein SLEP1_g56022 [Rubroshorea leprosula]|uniref:Uncharacterized protein n=1 Tax=Rubroshorea leprosula TaxID=152421 RepID=A0AAV5MJF6_9ROSI|nr:hypothetical protein SLEP1_g56022 [Rubroshorea leprosula]
MALQVTSLPDEIAFTQFGSSFLALDIQFRVQSCEILIVGLKIQSVFFWSYLVDFRLAILLYICAPMCWGIESVCVLLCCVVVLIGRLDLCYIFPKFGIIRICFGD